MSAPRTWIAAAALGLLAWPAAAQNNVADQLNYSRQTLKAQKRTIISGSIPFTEGEEKAFWPIVDDYDKERDAVDDREVRLLQEYIVANGNLTDQRAMIYLNETLKIREDRLAVRRKYMKRFAGVLPPRKLVQFFQIESRLDALLAADLARAIPLMK